MWWLSTSSDNSAHPPADPCSYAIISLNAVPTSGSPPLRAYPNLQTGWYTYPQLPLPLRWNRDQFQPGVACQPSSLLECIIWTQWSGPAGTSQELPDMAHTMSLDRLV